MTQTKEVKDTIVEFTRNLKTSLDKVLLNNDIVFVVPHNSPVADFDALGASLGIALICKKNKKKCYIIIDTDLSKFGAEERKVVEYLAKNFNVINSKLANELMNDKSLMVAVDVSKEMLLSDDTKKLIPNFNDIFLIDHHEIDERTIKTNNTFVNDKLSSTCEEIVRLLHLYKVEFSPEIANFLFAGIALDTNKLTKNATCDTFGTVSMLIAKGANLTDVYNMFSVDYESDKRMLKIINNVVFPTQIYGIACDEEKNKIYDPTDIAKASDYLLNYKINASFALGYIDEETISISARSKGGIDVGAIMKLFGGGGNEFSAAARVKGETVESLRSKLEFILNPSSYLKSGELSLECDGTEMQMKLVK